LPIYEFEGKSPKVNDSSYVHEMATLIGNVEIGRECFVGAGSVLRGDYGTVLIGDRTSAQENSVLHAREEGVVSIGSDVQIGHGAVLHNCEVKDYAVVGLGSRICDYSVVGRWAIIGEGAVVSNGTKIPDGKVAVGVPAKVIRDVNDEERNLWSHYKAKYVELSHRYRIGLKKI
jgi:carbonic anhydrase/acetyltransferase-like protein (isoleucine patch superfamily)